MSYPIYTTELFDCEPHGLALTHLSMYALNDLQAQLGVRHKGDKWAWIYKNGVEIWNCNATFFRTWFRFEVSEDD
jgi:hypothetical protein